jgi:hypothetical protein
MSFFLCCSPGNKCSPDNMDPYVILTCRSQEQKSSVANGTRFSLFCCYINMHAVTRGRELDANLIANPFFLSLIQEKEASLNGTRPSSSLSMTIPRIFISRSWTAMLWMMISLVQQRKYSGILLLYTGLHYSLRNPCTFCTKFSSQDHASELFSSCFCRLQPECLTSHLYTCNSELSASPWRLCFGKAAFLRQLTQSSRRRNTAERSSLHSPSLQQWYCTLQSPCGCNGQPVLCHNGTMQC